MILLALTTACIHWLPQSVKAQVVACSYPTGATSFEVFSPLIQKWKSAKNIRTLSSHQLKLVSTIQAVLDWTWRCHVRTMHRPHFSEFFSSNPT
jgi:hypothetical protein